MPKLMTTIINGLPFVNNQGALEWLTLNEALAADAYTAHQQREVIRRLVLALSYWLPKSTPPKPEPFDAQLAIHREEWADATAALAAAQPFLD